MGYTTYNIRKIFFPLAVICFVVLLMSGCKKNETYTITYDANGGTGIMEPQTVKYGETFSLKRNMFTRENYVFVNWNSVPDGSGISFDEGHTFIASSGGCMTLYAQWASNTATVTFNANGGSGDMPTQTFTIGTAQALSSNSFTWDNHEFIGWNTLQDGTGTAYSEMQEIIIEENIVLYAQWITVTGQQGGHYYVDLGLPSGIKWATCNVGASSPVFYGDYFAWGETSPKSNYDWSTYRWCNGSENALTKYCDRSSYGNNGFIDNLTTLEASDDAATANWGSGWRMPTKTEMEELFSNCTKNFKNQNGIKGCVLTGPNGNSIFLPAGGDCNGSNIYGAGSHGDYWSSSLFGGTPPFAASYYFELGIGSMNGNERIIGKSVRPVYVN